MTRFAVFVLCPGATYSDLLMESREQGVAVLEMIPFSGSVAAYAPYFELPDRPPLLFVMRAGTSKLVEKSEDLPAALTACGS